MSPAIRSYAIALAARLIAMLGPIGVAVITARMLGPEDRGRYYYVVTLAALGAQLASFGIHSSNSFLIAKQPGLLPSILANSAWIALAGGLLAACSLLAFDILTNPATSGHGPLLFTLVLCPLLLMFLYLTNIAVALNRQALFNALIIFNGLVAVLAAAAVALGAPSLHWFLIAAAVALLMSCVPAWARLARRIDVPWSFDKALFAHGIAFAARAHIVCLLPFFMTRTPLMILRQTDSFADVGYWSIALQICDALAILPSTVGLLLFPAMVRADNRARWADFIATAVKIGAAMAVICLVAALLAQPAITLVFGASYAPAVGITLALLPGVFLLSIITIASQMLSAYGIPWTQIAAWTIGWAVQLTVSLYLVRSHGALGLAWAQSACFALVCALLLVNASRYRPRLLPETGS